jgi:copper transport protein
MDRRRPVEVERTAWRFSIGTRGHIHIHSDRAMAEVTIQPGRPGMARAIILLMNEDFSPLTAKDVVFDFSLEGHPEVGVLSRPATLLPDGNWEVNKLEIERTGVWIVNLKIRAEKLSIELDGRIAIDGYPLQ